jgi:hypothetical protein
MRLGHLVGRLALVIGGLVAGLVVLELLLQAGAAIHAKERELPRWVTGRRRILALGDSNTYGLYVDRRQAYPSVLEEAWNRKHPDAPIEVLNAGYPGMNSSHVRNALPGLLRTLRPDLVLVMVGANDLWTVPEPPAENTPSGGVQDALWRYSRVYRLFFMLQRNVFPTSMEIASELTDGRSGHAVLRYGKHTFQLGYRVPAQDEQFGTPGLRPNLITIATLARSAHVDLAFVSYPSFAPTMAPPAARSARQRR